MPGLYYDQGRKDAQNGDFNQLFYHTYLDYKRGYDEVKYGSPQRHFKPWMKLLLIAALAVIAGWFLRNMGIFAPPQEPVVMIVTPTVTTPTPTFPFVIATPAPATPVPEKPIARTAEVITAGGSSLRVRPSPSLDGEPVATLDSGTIVTILNGPQNNDGYDWWEIEANGVRGWAAADFLNFDP